MIQLIKRDRFLTAGRVLDRSIGWRGVKLNEYLKQATEYVWEKHPLDEWPSLTHTGATRVLTFPSSQPHFLVPRCVLC